MTIAVSLIVLTSDFVGNMLVQRDDYNRTKHDVWTGIVFKGASTKDAEDIAKHSFYKDKDLLWMATSVNEHCHDKNFCTATEWWECQQICHNHFLCFGTERGVAGNSEGLYDCRGNLSKLCQVFAGCKMLFMEDIGSLAEIPQ